MSEVVYPPIASIFIAILAILVILSRQCLQLHSQSLLNGNWLGYDLTGESEEPLIDIKVEFGPELNCNQIGGNIESIYGDRSADTLIKFGKNFGAYGLKRLLECNFLTLEDTDTHGLSGALIAFLNEFADWSALLQIDSDLFERLSSIVEVDQMTTWALKSFPTPQLVQKIKKLSVEGKMVVKLPMNTILNDIITALIRSRSRNVVDVEPVPSAYMNFWKLFNAANFAQLNPPDQVGLMKYLSFLGPKLSGEDFVLWSLKSETFMLAKLYELQAFSKNIVYVYYSDNYFVWMEKYAVGEAIVNHFVNGRDKVNRKFGMFPIHNDLREALIEAAIGRNGLKRSALTQILLEPKPVDRNSRLPEDIELEKSNFATELMKVYDTNSLFTPKLSFKEFLNSLNVDINDPLLTLELLRCYSCDEEEIMSIFEACHDVTEGHPSGTTPNNKAPLYSEQIQVASWLSTAFKLNSPRIANFFITRYNQMMSLDLPEIVRKSKDNGAVTDPLKFFLYPGTGMEMKAALLRRSTASTKFHRVLRAEFVDFEERIQLLTAEEALNPELPSGKAKKENNQRIRSLLKQSVEFFLNNWENLKVYRIHVAFLEMAGQDTGGLARHYVTLILKLLVDEDLGLFHRLPDTNSVVPRTLLDANVMGFIGMLHGQCLKLGIKAPWLLEMDHRKQPIKLSDLITEISRDTSMFPSLEDILIYANEKYKMFEDRFDFSHLSLLQRKFESDFADNIERAYWHAGIEAYKDNLFGSLDPKLHAHGNLILNDILEILKPFEFDEINKSVFMECFRIENEESVDGMIVLRVREAIKLSLTSDFIPKILKFATGSSVLPIGFNIDNHPSLFSINIRTIHDPKQKRMPQASTCTRTIFWTIERREGVEEVKKKFMEAVNGSKGFDLN